jgi:hypothetical protein
LHDRFLQSSYGAVVCASQYQDWRDK